MRITILANYDLPSNYALNILLQDLGEHELTIFLSDRVGKAGQRPHALENLAFFEQSLFTRLLFPALSGVMNGEINDGMKGGVNLEDRPYLMSFEGLAKKSENPIRILNAINKGEGFATLKDSNPDLIVTIRYGIILKEEVIALPQYGVINLHSGLLPEYKGVMASFRALLAGDEIIGTTLHYIPDASIDTGPVIGTSSFKVVPNKSYLWHVLSLYPCGCELILQTIETIASHGCVDSEHQLGGGNYYSFPTETELEEFSRSGRHLFDVGEILDFANHYLPKVNQER